MVWLDRFTSRLKHDPQLLSLNLSIGWVLVGLQGIIVSAFCFSVLFLPPDWQIPFGMGWLIGGLAALFLLSRGLSVGHLWRGDQLKSDFPGRAIQHYKWSLRLFPQSPLGFARWGNVLLEQGEKDNAKRCFERAHKMSPDDPEGLLGLAQWALRDHLWPQACRYLDQAYRLQRGLAWNDTPDMLEKGVSPILSQPPRIETSRFKLDHDQQQLGFLLEGHYLPQNFAKLQQACQNLLKETAGQTGKLVLTKTQSRSLQSLYGRNLYHASVPAFPGKVMNPLNQAEQLTAQFQTEGLVYLDNFLRYDVLEALQHFCEKSTIWHDDHKPGGYLGSYMEDGFSCELLHQIADELRQSLPELFEGLYLRYMWGYKYDSQGQGIGIHADGAILNVNFWITPDSANRDPEHGGLLVYDVEAPSDWNFEDYNQDTAKTEAFLKQHNAQSRCVPYRQNRCVLFNSKLFHATDRYDFMPGYTQRRINITFLYDRG